MSALSQIINEARAGKFDWRKVGEFPARMLTTDEAWNQFKAEKRNAENRAMAAKRRGSGALPQTEVA